ncbi:hypothetical protein WG66_010898 [Moniliophthora roreri]|nr:hypothetical protein WG66_010898 [Moniliophthora roreri]
MNPRHSGLLPSVSTRIRTGRGRILGTRVYKLQTRRLENTLKPKIFNTLLVRSCIGLPLRAESRFKSRDLVGPSLKREKKTSYYQTHCCYKARGEYSSPVLI